ncbi:MAG: isocitrate/isopropylmalate family dehydrogenase, partial [Planctomycetaceae bacterium]
MDAQLVLLPGDGIGPEIVAEAENVLTAVSRRFGHTFQLQSCEMGGIAIDRHGTPLPDETLAACRASHAILLGAVGGPKWDDPTAKTRPEAGLLGLRQELGLFANLRPIQPHPDLLSASPLKPEIIDGVDILFVRELTGGIYFGDSGRRKHESGEEAFNVMQYATHEIERVVRVAGESARTRRGRVTSVDKANVLEVSRLWRQVAERVIADEFPDVEYEVVLVDDGSRDGSAELIGKLQKHNSRLRLIRFSENSGQSAAFMAGFRAANGRIIITMDADLSGDPSYNKLSSRIKKDPVAALTHGDLPFDKLFVELQANRDT